MTDTTWTIATDRYGTLTFDGAISDTIPTFRVGEETSITLYSNTRDDSDIERLREYARYANGSTSNSGTDIRGEPWYHESLHPSSDFYSQVVLVEPASSVSQLEHWWCLITNGEIETNNVGTNPRVTLDLFVLGSEAEFATRSDIETLEADL